MTKVIALGRPDQHSVEAWSDSITDCEFVYYPLASSSGYRFGKRIAGIGVDAAVAAVLSRWPKSDSSLALNPWTGLACRVAGHRNVAVTGLYSVPESSSWLTLRAGLRDAPVIVMSRSEAESWVAAGGRCRSVLYGATTGIGMSDAPKKVLEIFVGGTSDRDEQMTATLERQVTHSEYHCRLTVADGSGPRRVAGRSGSVEYLPYVSRDIFLERLRLSHVSVLPLRDNGRAAGQMVLAASLEAGLPVLCTNTIGMEEYRERGLFNAIRTSTDILEQAVSLAIDADLNARLVNRQLWRANLSVSAYTASVVRALEELDWPG